MKKTYNTPNVKIVDLYGLQNVLIATSERPGNPETDPNMGLAGEDYGLNDDDDAWK